MKATINGMTFDGTAEEMAKLLALRMSNSTEKPLHVETARRVGVADEIELFPTEKKAAQIAENYRQKYYWKKTVYLHTYDGKATSFPNIAAMLRHYKVNEAPLFSGHYSAEQYTCKAAQMLIDAGVSVGRISRCDTQGRLRSFQFQKRTLEVKHA